MNGKDIQEGGGLRHGDHLPPHRYIRNTTTCRTTPTEHLLNTGRRPQTFQSRVTDRVLVLQPGVRPVPLRWESQVQDIGPPETSQLHVISNGESSPKDLHLNAKTEF